MVCLKLELIVTGSCNDLNIRLKEIPQLMNFPQIAEECINDYMKKINIK